MASAVDFQIVTPGEVKFKGKAEIVVAPGSAGDIGALAHHAPLLMTLRPGILKATAAAAQSDPGQAATRRIEYAVDGGFMEILPDKIIVLTDVALTAGDIDPEAARADLRRAEESLAAKHGVDDRAERRHLAWANACVEVMQRRAI